jgi:hypothetical protein
VTSDRKIRANRENARASTGPKSAQGRARAARNTLRHGLSLPVYSNPGLSEEVEALAHQIAGPNANAETRLLAHQVAEAQIDLGRVRYARHQLLSQALSNPHDSHANMRKKLVLVRRVLGRNPPDISLRAFEKLVTSTPEGPQKLATILSEEAKRLLALDRYERRALSRRKSAIRALDDARLQLDVASNKITINGCYIGRTKPK